MIEKKIADSVLSEGSWDANLRESIYHFNEIDLTPAKRQYILEHPQVMTARAWQGYKREKKWQVLSGFFKILLVKVDNWERPSISLDFQEFILRSTVTKILQMPGGYATGFRAMERICVN
jgi:dTDP-4-dehydrorhamnose 3,5-epimerase